MCNIYYKVNVNIFYNSRLQVERACYVSDNGTTLGKQEWGRNDAS